MFQSCGSHAIGLRQENIITSTLNVTDDSTNLFLTFEFSLFNFPFVTADGQGNGNSGQNSIELYWLDP